MKITDFFNRPFAICCILMVAHELCGVFIMSNYASLILRESAFSSGMIVIFISAIQLIGSVVSSLLIDRLGRKVLTNF